MKLKVLWSKKAERDFFEILEYYNSIEMFSVRKNISRNIFRTIDLISENPKLGKTDTILGESYRYILTSGVYKLVYKLYEDKLYILKIFDARRNPRDF